MWCQVHSVVWNCLGTKLASGSVDHTARVSSIDAYGHVILLPHCAFYFCWLDWEDEQLEYVNKLLLPSAFSPSWHIYIWKRKWAIYPLVFGKLFHVRGKALVVRYRCHFFHSLELRCSSHNVTTGATSLLSFLFFTALRYHYNFFLSTLFYLFSITTDFVLFPLVLSDLVLFCLLFLPLFFWSYCNVFFLIFSELL